MDQVIKDAQEKRLLARAQGVGSSEEGSIIRSTGMAVKSDRCDIAGASGVL